MPTDERAPEAREALTLTEFGPLPTRLVGMQNPPAVTHESEGDASPEVREALREGPPRGVEYDRRSRWDCVAQQKAVADLLGVDWRSPVVDAIDWLYRPALERLEYERNEALLSPERPDPERPVFCTFCREQIAGPDVLWSVHEGPCPARPDAPGGHSQDTLNSAAIENTDAPGGAREPDDGRWCACGDGLRPEDTDGRCWICRSLDESAPALRPAVPPEEAP